MNDLSYPNLDGEKIIGLDIETYDPGLKEFGSGVYRREGYILGFSVATKRGFKEYYGLKHYDNTEEDFNKGMAYLKYIGSLNIPKVGANILYDLDWIENWAYIPVAGSLHDVQLAEPLLDENKYHYDLDSLSMQYLGIHKDKTNPEIFCEQNNLKGDFRQHLYLMPYDVVRGYGKTDAMNPLDILDKQLVELDKQNMRPLYNMERKLMRLLLQMRKTGVRVNIPKLRKIVDEETKKITALENAFYVEHGKINLNSTAELVKLFDKYGIPYSYTEKDNPSITKAVLENIEHPLGKQIVKIKSGTRIIKNFLIGQVLNYSVNGRVHCNFKSLKRDDGGTISGRFSAADPNLHSAPARDEEWGKLSRSVFIPEEGKEWWKLDYSQIEYRCMAHYARGPGSDEIRKIFVQNPDTDYHQMVAEMVHWKGKEGRRDAKTLNFAIAYCLGLASMCKKYGWTMEKARSLTNTYNELMPFIDFTRRTLIREAKNKGYLTTYYGRRERLCPRLIAEKREFSMFNRLMQGTAADINKLGMLKAYEAGVYDVLDPHITLHDEIDVSAEIGPSPIALEALKELKNSMEHCAKLSIPIIASCDKGPNWGDVQEVSL